MKPVLDNVPQNSISLGKVAQNCAGTCIRSASWILPIYYLGASIKQSTNLLRYSNMITQYVDDVSITY